MCKDLAMHRVVVLALPGVYPFEMGIPKRVFGSVVDSAGAPLYEVVTAGLGAGPVPTAADFAVTVEHGPEILATAGTVVVPALEPLAPMFTDGAVSDELRAALAHLRPGTRLVSICTGAYVLAAAGLLDGRPATNHWYCAEHFQRLFPRIAVDPTVLFVDDGDVLTSAGAAAGVDLCLHIVRRDHGSEIANAVARRCVVPPWRDGGQAQYIEQPVPEHTETSTAPTREWALQRLDEPLNLAALAGHARMSIRTFTRRFRQETGVTPGSWLISQRVDLARHLLETTDLPVERVAERAGFGTAASFRMHLRTVTGVGPHSYRRTFRHAPAAA
ncbi:AraC family transcriptional regulator [Actinoplanes philippinensis]|uniref:Transcriptional regulator GlxA family, contains an amidase domain and an AraC-type DNA-binding HTH domain n=2 Tax=Actinoplanes philippinensis TaxID=35752 RepID=A0A1I2CR77_9ACTN|nr:AraC family transcriptional regulator [Actinoplanes philippinensis]SFE70734.1 Transcriptional regulator GlxA family, contains an amidase domain and an AraC-type DNA-binding HTH domain [Actinoplanes philippinensis]